MLKKILILIFIITSFLGYPRELNFDAQGNLIDKKLDKIYELKTSYVYLGTYKFKSFGMSYYLTSYKKFQLDSGFTFRRKYVYIAIGRPIIPYVNLLVFGISYGYSFTYHKPFTGIFVSIISISF